MTKRKYKDLSLGSFLHKIAKGDFTHKSKVNNKQSTRKFKPYKQDKDLFLQSLFVQPSKAKKKTLALSTADVEDILNVYNLF